MLNGPSSIAISSPLRFPRFKQVEPRIDFKLLAKQYFSDCQSLNLVFIDSSTGEYILKFSFCSQYLIYLLCCVSASSVEFQIIDLDFAVECR